jgi:hypothetical protein
VPQEEALIIASVLSLNVTQLQGIDGRHKDGKRDPMEYVAARRMVTLLNLIDHIQSPGVPSGINFLSPSNFLSDVKEATGYSWATSTWLSKQAHSYALFRPERQMGTIGKYGLLVHFPGLVLYCPNQPVVHHKFWQSVHQCMHKWFKAVADTQGVEWKQFWE